MAFTPEELAEMAAADAEIEAEFCMTQEEIDDSRERDYVFRVDSMDNKQLGQRRYYEANKDKIAEGKRRYYEANKDKIAEGQIEMKAFRKSRCLTQTEFALLAGVTQATVSIWENISAPRNWREIIAKVRELHDLEGMGAH